MPPQACEGQVTDGVQRWVTYWISPSQRQTKRFKTINLTRQKEKVRQECGREKRIKMIAWCRMINQDPVKAFCWVQKREEESLGKIQSQKVIYDDESDHCGRENPRGCNTLQMAYSKTINTSHYWREMCFQKVILRFNPQTKYSGFYLIIIIIKPINWT